MFLLWVGLEKQIGFLWICLSTKQGVRWNVGSRREAGWGSNAPGLPQCFLHALAYPRAGEELQNVSFGFVDLHMKVLWNSLFVDFTSLVII